MATSEHIKEETQESPNDEHIKALRQEWEGWQRAKLEKQLNADEQVLDEPGSAQQTKDEIIEELKRKLEKTNRINNELESENMKLVKANKCAEESAKANLEEKNEIKELRQKINKLKCALQRETERKSKDILQNGQQNLQEENIQFRDKNEKLEKELNDSRRLCNDFKIVIDNLKDEIKILKNTIEQFKDEHLQYLQCTGKLCAHNCVLCTILWTCQQKLEFYPCGLQLLILLYHKVASKIEREDLICHKLIMEIFIKWKIVAIAAECKYPTEENAKLEVIREAWERIMTMDDSERVLILGRIAEDGRVGHAEVCDLDTRTSNTVDGTLKIYNPQRDIEHPIRENFIDLVKNDKGLIIYLVHLGKLEQIFTENESIVHASYIST